MERTNSRRRKPGVTKVDANVDDAAPVQDTSSPSIKACDAGVTQFWSRPWPLQVARLVLVTLTFTSVGLLLLNHLGSAPWILEDIGRVLRGSDQLSNNHSHENIAILLHPEDHVHRMSETLTYDWKVTKGLRSPDGVRKEVYLINNQFPGETVEARSGDRIVVRVTNWLKDEGLAIHWHGLRMEGANEMDGAVGVTQMPIPPGGSFLYNFTIGEEEFGTFWYHGHEKTQRDDGLYGGFIVHCPAEQCDEKNQYNYDEDVLLLIGDWYHRSSTEVLGWYMTSRSFGNEPVPDSLLVNGEGNFDCEMAVPARPVDCVPREERTELPVLKLGNGNGHRLRLVNTGSLTGFSFRMHNATISPFQVDGGNHIAPSEVQGIGIVYPGERVDAILQIGPSDGPRYFEIEMDDENFRYPNPALNPVQVFPVLASPSPVHGSQLTRPDFEYYNLQAAVGKSTSQVLWPGEPMKFVVYATTLKLAKHHNIPMGFINHTSWSPQSSPPVPLLSLPRAEYDRNQLSPHIPPFEPDTRNNDLSSGWVDIVINNLDDGGHPFHLHGYSFYVVSVFPPPTPWSSEKPSFVPGGSAMYTYNPFTTTPQDSPAGDYNLVTPVMKDTVFVPQRGYAVIRFRSDNKGIWMMHCHVGWHLGSGMAMSWDIT